MVAVTDDLAAVRVPEEDTTHQRVLRSDADAVRTEAGQRKVSVALLVSGMRRVWDELAEPVRRTALSQVAADRVQCDSSKGATHDPPGSAGDGD